MPLPTTTLADFESYSVALVLAVVLPPVDENAQRQTVAAQRHAGALMPGIAEAVLTEAVRQATQQAAQAVVVKLGEQTHQIVAQTQARAAQGLLDAITEAGLIASGSVDDRSDGRPADD